MQRQLRAARIPKAAQPNRSLRKREGENRGDDRWSSVRACPSLAKGILPSWFNGAIVAQCHGGAS
jgi:hypothetical protein